MTESYVKLNAEKNIFVWCATGRSAARKFENPQKSRIFYFLANFHAGSPGPVWKKGADLEVWVHPQLLS
jgi:hypothetical protein